MAHPKGGAPQTRKSADASAEEGGRVKNRQVQAAEAVKAKAAELAKLTRREGLPMLAYLLDSLVIIADRSIAAANQAEIEGCRPKGRSSRPDSGQQ